MKCKNIGFGTYDCAYCIKLPWLVKNPCDPNESWKSFYATIDKCLLPEILKLWEMGIKTTGCCCGHGDKELAFIGVTNKDIERMKQMGYRVQYNPLRPNDEDSFYPKTVFDYDNADKGFNKWDSKDVPCPDCVCFNACINAAREDSFVKCDKYENVIKKLFLTPIIRFGDVYTDDKVN